MLMDFIPKIHTCLKHIVIICITCNLLIIGSSELNLFYLLYGGCEFPSCTEVNADFTTPKLCIKKESEIISYVCLYFDFLCYTSSYCDTRQTSFIITSRLGFHLFVKIDCEQSVNKKCL
jgi:hypothetical protein